MAQASLVMNLMVKDAASKSVGQISSGFAKLAASIGSVVAAGAGLSSAMSLQSGRTKLKQQLNLSAQDSKAAGKLAGELYGQAYGESIGDVNRALRLASQNTGLKVTSAEVRQLTKESLALADVFEEDAGGITRAAGQLVRTGLARDTKQAMDLITSGFQSGIDKSEDFLDTLNEYSTLFRNLGLDGATAMGLLSQGIQAGARDSDKVADALKEFSIRAVDGSKASSEAYRTLGLNARQVTKMIARSGPDAARGLQVVLGRLRAMRDPVKRTAAAVGLFGTQAEDLGDALFALDLPTATRHIQQVEGAASKLDKEMGTTWSAVWTSAKRKVEVFANDGLNAVIDGFKGGERAGSGLMRVLGDIGGLARTGSHAVNVFWDAAAGRSSSGEFDGWLNKVNRLGIALNDAGRVGRIFFRTLQGKGTVEKFDPLWVKIDGIAKSLREGGLTAKSWFGALTSGFKGVEGATKQGGLVGFLAKVGQEARRSVDFYKDLFAGIKRGVQTGDWSQLGRTILDRIRYVFGRAKDIGGSIWGSIKDAARRVDWAAVGAKVKDGLGRALATGKNFVADMWSRIDWGQIRSVLRTGLSRALDFGRDLGSKGMDLASSLLDRLRTAMSNIDWPALGSEGGGKFGEALSVGLSYALQGANWLSGKLSELIDRVDWHQVGQTIGNFVSNALASIDWAGLQGKLRDLLWTWITEVTPQVGKAAGELFMGLGQSFVQSLWDGAKAKWDEFAEWLRGRPAAARDAVGDMLFGWIPGGGGDLGTGTAERFAKGVKPRALGGPVMAGHPYLVGERGYELFIPSQPGSVMPHGDVEAMTKRLRAFNPGGGGSKSADPLAGLRELVERMEKGQQRQTHELVDALKSALSIDGRKLGAHQGTQGDRYAANTYGAPVGRAR